MNNDIEVFACDRFYLHGLILIPAWISNHTQYNVWDEIIYPFLNFNGATLQPCNRWSLEMDK